MKVYRVKVDVNRFQYFLPRDKTAWSGPTLLFDCSPKQPGWVAPELYVYQPKLLPGSFSNLMMSGALIVERSAMESVTELLEMSGELLPFSYQERNYYILNVLGCFDVLDHERTEWNVVEGMRGSLKRYVFDPDRLPETPLFKIPETCRGEILTIEGMKDPQDEFKPTVERLGLTGLKFEELWSDQAKERPGRC
jgi:hypothetical protein